MCGDEDEDDDVTATDETQPLHQHQQEEAPSNPKTKSKHASTNPMPTLESSMGEHQPEIRHQKVLHYSQLQYTHVQMKTRLFISPL